ncbi:GGNB2 protein, partial [Polypterus senegalus]
MNSIQPMLSEMVKILGEEDVARQKLKNMAENESGQCSVMLAKVLLCYFDHLEIAYGYCSPCLQALVLRANTAEDMARLVAVCRDGEEDFPFLERQIPLYIDDTLTYHSMLKQQDLNIAMMVTSREVFSALSQLVPCVGCRRSVERLFSQLVESGNPALEPLTVGSTGVLSLTRACMTDAKKLYTLFYVHGFCTDCKNKVLRAYNILIGELDCSKEKGYCAALYEGLRCCPHERHIHVCCETDFIAHLLGRAEPEFAGGRRERHAKTIDIAQEEVLTCLGIHLYERLHRIWQKLRAEEQTWQMLFYLGVDALRKSFEMAVEKVQGISRLEQLCEELSEEERVRELKQEKKRQKRKNRRKNKCGFEMPGQDVEDKVKSEQDLSEPVKSSCKACGNIEETSHCVEVIVTNETASCNCHSSVILGSPKEKKGLSPQCNGSDCGYSSSMEGSETGSREGSDVACTEGICNHDETGDYSCVHQCVEDKEDDGDSCVECWANAEENLKSKNKKKKKKSKSSLNGNEQDESEGTSDEENYLTQDEIQSFVANNQSFYSNRDQYRQHLKEKFNTYCRSNEPRKQICSGGWFTTTGVI